MHVRHFLAGEESGRVNLGIVRDIVVYSCDCGERKPHDISHFGCIDKG